MTTPPQIVQGPQNGTLGVLAGGNVQRGSAVLPGNLTGLVAYANAGATGGVSPVLLPSIVWRHAEEKWASAGTGSIGGASLPYLTLQSGAVFAFTSTSDVVGVLGGGGNATLRVRLLVDEGQGWKHTQQLNPLPDTNGLGSGLYFLFASSVSRKFLMYCDGPGPGALVLRSAASVSPFNPLDGTLRFAAMGDSVGAFKTVAADAFLYQAIGSRLGAYATIYSGDGGTGYGHSGLSSLLSLSGNQGTYEPGDPLNADPSRTDYLAGGASDIVVVMSGVNESIPTGSGTGGGWDTQSAMNTTWQRLRADHPDAVLVCMDPWVGNNGGTNDGGAGSKYPALRDALDTAMESITGPWLRVHNYAGMPAWRLRQQVGTEVTSSLTLSDAWVTGMNGTENVTTHRAPANAVLGDGVHPLQFDIATVSSVTTSSITLDNGQLFPQPLSPAVSVQLAVFPATGPMNYSGLDQTANTTYSYTASGGAITNILSGVTPNPSGIAIGSRVVVFGQEPGTDYYVRRVAESIRNSMSYF
jgi:hypothetical protein